MTLAGPTAVTLLCGTCVSREATDDEVSCCCGRIELRNEASDDDEEEDGRTSWSGMWIVHRTGDYVVRVQTRPASGPMSFVQLVRTRFSADTKSDHSPDTGCSRDPGDYRQVNNDERMLIEQHSGKHDYVDHVDSIGRVSYAFVQTYAHRTGRMFRRSASATLTISRLAHLPAGSILYRIPDKVNSKDNVVEVSSEMALKYKKLLSEQKELVAGVTRLNTVQRHGKPNINVVDIEEEEDVDV
ncbi:hypothetical protein B0H11DRAFT_2358259 [Mycena galericulata]|nr:hypothetical protein B0H11DRAFT_2358259 [Mycena galericulata]